MTRFSAPSPTVARAGFVSLVALSALLASGCAADAPPTAAAGPTASAYAGAELSGTQRAELVGVCAGEAEAGTVTLDEANARMAQRPNDDIWLVVIPVEFEALRNGEQQCAISGTFGDFDRVAVLSGEAWGDGEFERWLTADRLWYE